MCTQAMFLMKQTYWIITTWEEILKLLLPVQGSFHSVSQNLEKSPVILSLHFEGIA